MDTAQCDNPLLQAVLLSLTPLVYMLTTLTYSVRQLWSASLLTW